MNRAELVNLVARRTSLDRRVVETVWHEAVTALVRAAQIGEPIAIGELDRLRAVAPQHPGDFRHGSMRQRQVVITPHADGWPLPRAKEQVSLLQRRRARQPSPWQRHLVPELRDPDTGRLDARRVARFFGIPLKTLAQSLGRGYSTVAKTANAPALQAALEAWERIAVPFCRLDDPAHALRSWLNAPHPEFGDEPPLQFLREGHVGAVADFVEDLLLGQPG